MTAPVEITQADREAAKRLDDALSSAGLLKDPHLDAPEILAAYLCGHRQSSLPKAEEAGRVEARDMIAHLTKLADESYTGSTKIGVVYLRKIIAALAHPPSADQVGEGVAIPQGWKLVPVELPEEMRVAANRIEREGGGWIRDFWTAMLAAAPVPPTPIADTAGVQTDDWQPADTAPKDGTILELVVDYTDGGGPLQDAIRACTIGWNGFDDTGEDHWHIVGWDWSHDYICAGEGKVLAWRPSRLMACDDSLPPLPAAVTSTRSGDA